MNEPATTGDNETPSQPEPLSPRQRRILGVLVEKARTTPDSYPLSLNGLVTGCNQKSNRSPLMSLTPEQVEDELFEMRENGLVAEVHGGGRVAKYRHYAYDYLGVKGVEAGVMTELLLRGEQTAGDLRTRASRFEQIADLKTLHEILESLIAKKLVVALTPPGRGQMFTHNLYSEYELESIKKSVAAGAPAPTRSSTSGPSPAVPANPDELQELKEEVAELRSEIEKLKDRLSVLEN